MKKVLLNLSLLIASGGAFCQFASFDPTFNQGNIFQLTSYAEHLKVISTGNETAWVHYNNGQYMPSPPYGSSNGSLRNFTNNPAENAATSSLHNLSFSGDKQYDIITDTYKAANNKLIITGYTREDYQTGWYGSFVARIDATTGVIDPTFNGGNYVLVEGETESYISRKVVELSNGKILFAGRENSSFFIRQLNADGTADNTFGTNGKRLFSVFGANYKELKDLKVLANGKFLVAGLESETIPFGEGNISVNRGFVAKFNADGTTDASFGNNGFVTFTFGQENGHSDVTSIDVTANGSIVVVGNGSYLVGGNSWKTKGSLVILNADGEYTFGFESPFSFEDGYSNFYKTKVLASGKILVAGAYFPSETTAGLFLRFNADGTIDTSEESDDIVVINESGFGNGIWIEDFDEQPDGKIIYVFGAAANTMAACSVGRIAGASTAGIEEGAQINSIHVFPNPANDVVKIQSSQPTEITVTTIDGAQVGTYTVNGLTTVSVADYPSGIYFIRTAEGQTVKFIKH
jgi:uncharacterized delta-60 repeat protein